MPEGTAPAVHTPAPSDRTSTPSDRVPAPSAPSDRTPVPSDRPSASSDRIPTSSDRFPAPADRRSMQVAMVAVLAGVLLAAIGAGQAWATIRAEVELPGIGAGQVGAAELTGNDLGPYGALALLGLVLLVAVAATRGRGRWVVGVALVALGGALVVGGLLGGYRAPAEARERAWTGFLAGVPTGTELQVARSPVGPALVVAGGLLLAAAGAEALRRGRNWPALGDAFRAPPDRVQPATGQDEPPWEGD